MIDKKQRRFQKWRFEQQKLWYVLEEYSIDYLLFGL